MNFNFVCGILDERSFCFNKCQFPTCGWPSFTRKLSGKPPPPRRKKRHGGGEGEGCRRTPRGGENVGRLRVALTSVKRIIGFVYLEFGIYLNWIASYFTKQKRFLSQIWDRIAVTWSWGYAWEIGFLFSVSFSNLSVMMPLYNFSWVFILDWLKIIWEV